MKVEGNRTQVVIIDARVERIRDVPPYHEITSLAMGSPRPFQRSVVERVKKTNEDPGNPFPIKFQIQKYTDGCCR